MNDDIKVVKIKFEGAPGSGKTTVAKAIYRALRSEGRTVAFGVNATEGFARDAAREEGNSHAYIIFDE